MSSFTVAALYKFTALPDCADLRDQLQALCEQSEIYGTLLLAEEGINGTVAGPAESIAKLRAWFAADSRFDGLEYKESIHSSPPFLRLKVRLKPEIVTMGIPDTDPAAHNGTYVGAKEWNELIDDPETLVIDTRNDYEIEVGQFENAIAPNTKHFREFPDYVQNQLDPKKHRKIAMYCTGGIRCEKASHYMLKNGFEEVYHLKGGILQYLEDVPAEDNRWLGECFVFDERVAVDKNLQQGEYQLCRSCRQPLAPADREHEKYERGVSCAHCYDTLTERKKAGARERFKQMKLAAERGEKHLGRRDTHRHGKE